jgi:hypothetical protein
MGQTSLTVPSPKGLQTTAWEHPDLPVVMTQHLDEMRRTRRDLREAVHDYERRLILHALAIAGGQQRRAAAVLGVLPTTLNEKMARLGIRGGAALMARAVPPAVPAGEDFRWQGVMPAGSSIEILGVAGSIRAVAVPGDDALVVARRRDARGAGRFAIGVARTEGRLSFSVLNAADAVIGSNNCDRPLGAQALVVDFEIRVPRPTNLTARLLRGTIEVHGVDGVLDLHALDGHVRTVPAVRAGEPA